MEEKQMILPILFINTKHNISKTNSNLSLSQNNSVTPKPIQKNDSVSFGCYNFFVKEMKSIPCGYCGKTTLSIKNIEDMMKAFETETGAKAVSILKQSYSQLDNQHKAIIDVLAEAINKQPLKRVKSIVIELACKFEKTTNEKYNKAIEKAFERSFIKKGSETSSRLRALIEKSRMFTNGHMPEKAIDQKIIKLSHLRESVQRMMAKSEHPATGQLSRFLHTLNNETSFIKRDPESFFPKYGKPDKAGLIDFKTFLVNLFDPIMISAEHLTPHVKGGIDNSSNFIAVCKHCNKNRGEMPFLKFLEIFPDAINHIKNQLTFFDNLMLPKTSKAERFLYNPNKQELGNYLTKIRITLQKKMGKPLTVDMPNHRQYLEWKKNQYPAYSK